MSYSLSFTKSIFVVLFIADKIRQGQYNFLSTGHISKILNIPRPTLVKILQNLHIANIIETKEGKQGGIRLIKKPSEITVLSVLEAMEKGKPLFQTSFNILVDAERPNKAQVIVKDIFKDAESVLKAELSKKTIEDILIEMGK